MEKIVRQSMLYDFYGELLTEHQKGIYEDVVVNDLSYSEIARLNGISRQGVYDMVKRCDKILEDYEEKLQLVKKFMDSKEKMNEMHRMIAELSEKNKDSALEEYIKRLSDKSEEIFEDF